MADQGLPLMALPQQNLFGAAGDDLASVLANREIAKRKQMLEDIDTQLKIQKGNSEAGLAQNTIDTGAQTRQFNAQEQPLKIQKIGDEHTTAADAHLKNIATQELNTKLRGAMDELDAATTPEARVIAGAHIKAYGGSLMTEAEAKALNAPTTDAAMQKLILDYVHATGPDKEAIGMRLAHLGLPAGALAPPKQYQFLDNGAAVGDLSTGKVGPTGFKPVSAASNADPQAVEGAYNTIKATGSLSGIPTNLVKAAFTLANSRNETIIPLTAMTKGMKETAQAQMHTFDDLTAAAQQMKDMDLMGTVRGRYRNLLAGESLADPNANYTPEQRHAIGNFEGLAKLFTSGTMLTHFRGRSGPGTYEIMQWLNPNGKDFDTYMGEIEAAHGVLQNYARLGGVVPNTPAAGSGKGGGPGTSAPVDPNNPMGLSLPRIK